MESPAPSRPGKSPAARLLKLLLVILPIPAGFFFGRSRPGSLKNG